jgi:hypothetical protein
MKKLVILLLLVLVVSTLFAGTYKAQVSVPSEVAVTEPLLAKFGYELPAGGITLTEETAAKVKSFTLYNGFPVDASVAIGVVSPPAGFTITPPSPPITIPPCPPYGPAHIDITYKATTAGSYMVTYLVTADIISAGGSAHVELTFDVLVTVNPKPKAKP